MRRIALTFAALLFSTSAHAHIVASPNTAESGAWFRTALRVGHGCEGSDTTKITVTVPSDILIIKPQVKPGWKITIEKQKLDQPMQGPHGMVSEITKTISWEGNLPDAYFDEFGLSMKLPEKTGAIYLPTHQHCTKGMTDWKDIPGTKSAPAAHDHHNMHYMPSFPAPVITVTPKQ